MATAQKKPQETADVANDDAEMTIPALARQTLQSSKGNPLDATNLFHELVMKDTSIYRALMDPLVREACYAAITKVCRQERRAIWNSYQPSEDEQRGRVIALSGGTIRTLLDFNLPNGLKLRDATRADVIEASEFFRKQSKDMGGKARWLQLIAQHIPARKKVAQVMSHERLAELREVATHE